MLIPTERLSLRIRESDRIEPTGYDSFKYGQPQEILWLGWVLEPARRRGRV